MVHLGITLIVGGTIGFLFLKLDVYKRQGYLFGPGGSGFERINLACPTRYLMAAMERFQKAISALK